MNKNRCKLIKILLEFIALGQTRNKSSLMHILVKPVTGHHLKQWWLYLVAHVCAIWVKRDRWVQNTGTWLEWIVLTSLSPHDRLLFFRVHNTHYKHCVHMIMLGPMVPNMPIAHSLTFLFRRFCENRTSYWTLLHSWWYVDWKIEYCLQTQTETIIPPPGHVFQYFSLIMLYFKINGSLLKFTFLNTSSLGANWFNMQ